MTTVETIMTMPALGEGVEEATVTRWLKQAGDRIEQDEPLLEAATDKVDTEIPAPCGGILDRFLVEEDETVAIGAPIAVITGLEQTAGPGEQSPPSPSAPPAPTPSEEIEELPPPIESGSGTPQTAETPIPADTVVTDAKPAADRTTASAGSTEKLPGIRRTIARRMLESLSTSAQLTTVLEADVTSVVRLRADHKHDFERRTGTRLSFLPFFAKAAVNALAEHRMLNASLNTDITEVTYHGDVHLGIAVDGPKGLMVPVIRGADTMTVEQLGTSITTAAERVRSGTITVDELNGGTFTITSTGSRGALFDTPIINQPQTGILGVGAVVERVVPTRDDYDALRIEVRSMVYLSLSYDHRIVDGADAARYLSAVKRSLENDFTAADLAASR